jgi:hypothetical protein
MHSGLACGWLALHTYKPSATCRLLTLTCCVLPPPPLQKTPCTGEDRRAGAARCLGELVRKMGERVLHRMLPILRDTMDSDAPATRTGVCTGLKEVRGGGHAFGGGGWTQACCGAGGAYGSGCVDWPVQLGQSVCRGQRIPAVSLQWLGVYGALYVGLFDWISSYMATCRY